MNDIAVPTEGAVVTVEEDFVQVAISDDPRERAAARFAQVQRSFTDVIRVVAEMHRDEDWRYLERADGSAYTSLPQVLSDALHISLAQARRYVQGARELVLPLMDLTVDGTRIPITSGEVAALGQEGLAEAAAVARERLAGVSDPDEQSGIIDAVIGETMAGRTATRVRDDFADDDDWDDDDPGTVTFPSSAGRDDFDDDGDPSPAPPAPPAPVDLTDPVERVMEGAQTFDDEAALAELPEDLRAVVAALNTLAALDPVAVSRLVTYPTRGVLVPVGPALTNVTMFQARVETLPWFVGRLTAP